MEVLAEQVAMSPRNFARIFTKEMNSPPQDLWSASGLRRPADARQQVNAAMTVKAEGPEFWRQLLKELAIHANSLPEIGLHSQVRKLDNPDFEQRYRIDVSLRAAFPRMTYTALSYPNLSIVTAT